MTVIPISTTKIIIFCYKKMYKIFFNIFSACIPIKIAQKFLKKISLAFFRIFKIMCALGFEFLN